MSGTESAARPSRVVHHAEALEWLRARGRLDGCSVVTSLPDVSEIPAFDLEAWTRWFEDAAALVVGAVPDDGVAIFFQSDIKRAGAWIDKGALVQRGAERAGARLLFHKIVCRKPPGTVTFGRAAYSHLLAYSRGVRPRPERATADVLLDAGFQPGTKAMGVSACVDACRFVLRETRTRTVVDPFCGYGTALAVANALGLDAIGVDLSARMCKKSRGRDIDIALSPGRPASSS
ncbi:MAG TPA: SAM-dependent methyltransferase [Polyangia bacterium]|nr:SAM-dependent methyltransferase [Polyangia bacterium]